MSALRMVKNPTFPGKGLDGYLFEDNNDYYGCLRFVLDGTLVIDLGPTMVNSAMRVIMLLDYNGSKNVLFLMRKDDPRYHTNSDYTHVTDVVKSSRLSGFDHRGPHKRWDGNNGVTYRVFIDWSAEAVATWSDPRQASPD